MGSHLHLAGVLPRHESWPSRLLLSGIREATGSPSRQPWSSEPRGQATGGLGLTPPHLCSKADRYQGERGSPYRAPGMY